MGEKFGKLKEIRPRTVVITALAIAMLGIACAPEASVATCTYYKAPTYIPGVQVEVPAKLAGTRMWGSMHLSDGLLDQLATKKELTFSVKVQTNEQLIKSIVGLEAQPDTGSAVVKVQTKPEACKVQSVTVKGRKIQSEEDTPTKNRV